MAASSSQTSVATLWWTMRLVEVITANSHGLPPFPAHTTVSTAQGYSISADPTTTTTTQATLHPAYLSSQPPSLTRPPPQERRIDQINRGRLVLSSLPKNLSPHIDDSKVILVWIKSLSDIVSEGTSAVPNSTTAPMGAVQVWTCGTDSFSKLRGSHANNLQTHTSGRHPSLVILLCRQENTTRVLEMVRRETRSRGIGGGAKGETIYLSLVTDSNGRNRWEEFEERDESEDVSSESRSFLTGVPADLHSLPPADLQGKQLKVSVVDNWPFFGLREGSSGRVQADAGIDVSILNTLSQTLNFT